MRFPFVELPGEAPLPRPAVLTVVENMDQASQWCLLDTGCARNIFPAWLAQATAIDLADADEQDFAIGRVTTTAHCAQVSLQLGPWSFEAPVWFADPWPFRFAVLGQEGFFIYFRVTLSALEGWIDCEPEPDAPVRLL